MLQEVQLRRDVETLRHVFAGLDRLEASFDAARPSIHARQRGYFAPDEDDCVRQLLLTYRNYRLALYEIIDRYFQYEQLGALAEQLRGFMVAYAAALTLYAKSLKIVQIYADEPLVRQVRHRSQLFRRGGSRLHFFAQLSFAGARRRVLEKPPTDRPRDRVFRRPRLCLALRSNPPAAPGGAAPVFENASRTARLRSEIPRSVPARARGQSPLRKLNPSFWRSWRTCGLRRITNLRSVQPHSTHCVARFSRAMCYWCVWSAN